MSELPDLITPETSTIHILVYVWADTKNVYNVIINFF